MTRLTRLAALAAAVLIAPAAWADNAPASSATPGAGIGAQMAAMVGSEHAVLASLPRGRMSQLAFPPAVAERDPADPDPVLGKPVIPATIDYTPAMLAALPAPRGGAEWECLAEALYFEARGESIRGQFAVGEVILNRVSSRAYPASVCSVVGQGAASGAPCQFSFMCDGRAEIVTEPSAFTRVGKIARLLLDGAPRALTDGATYFHNAGVRPSWSRKFTRTAEIGSHTFYRDPTRISSR